MKKKMNWLPRSPSPPMKRLHVKVKPLKLEGLSRNEEDDDDVHGVNQEKMVLVEMVWKGPPKSGLVAFYKSSSKHKRNRSSERIVGNGNSIEWEGDEFESLCDFSAVSKDRSSGSYDVLFNVLHGKNCEKKRKLRVVGKVSLDLAELVSKMECSEIERRLPVTLNVDDAAIEATLLILVSFAEVRGPLEMAGGDVQNSAESTKEDGFFKMVKGLTRQKKEKNSYKKDQLSSCGSDESLIFDSDGLNGNESATTTTESSSCELSLGPELESSQNLETTQNHMGRLFSWKKRRLSFRSLRKKTEPLITKTSEGNEFDHADQQPQTCSVVDPQDGNCWELKELVSRDGQARLKANVFFASFDQRSERAAGESACTALVAVIAHWLHSNQDFMPTRLDFDSLITQGSLEWRKLCDNVAYTNAFPDKHFDLETVLEADLRPVTVLQDRSFTGFFSPEKFECLKGAMSFDKIWNEEINRNDHDRPRVYIVSWNDHFFVLKVESNAYYIIDSLGERLFEGCNQAYMLKFDDSSLIHGKVKKENAGEAERKEEIEEIICSGKECCKEYIKRFLAAIPVRELEEQEKKGIASTFSLHKRLQIDFHYSSSSSSSSSSSTSSSCPYLSSAIYSTDIPLL